ncbi:hypothetical protein M8J76_000742 [Diaphorina citri]|nr:hypothetical protein M8J76_000742 [Diaphorina citri]
MRVPHTIDKNTLTVYAPPERITLSDDEYHSDSDDVEEEEIEEEEEEEEDEKLLGDGELKERKEQEEEEDFDDEEEEEEVVEESEGENLIDACDKNWDLDRVPLLSELAILTIANNFQQFQGVPLDAALTPEDWNILLEELPLDLPLELSVPLIPDSYYWKRACIHKWKKFTCYHHENSWKRMYLEYACQHFIEHIKPSQVVEFEIKLLTQLCEDYVKRLVIGQLLIEEVATDDGRVEFSYVDLSLILPELTALEELHITYGAKQCGLEFEWYKFQVTEKDIYVLSQCVADLPRLRILKVHRCRITDEMCEDLWSTLTYYVPLEELHFNHCALGDVSAIEIATIVIAENNLTHLDLTDNQIGTVGAQEIASSLLHPKCRLIYLSLKLNEIQDGGAREIALSLEKNTTLVQLCLAGCSFGPATFVQFGETLKVNSTLQAVDLSNNTIDMESCFALIEGLNSNKVIQELDVRMTGIVPRVELMLREMERMISWEGYSDVTSSSSSSSSSSNIHLSSSQDSLHEKMSKI